MRINTSGTTAKDYDTMPYQSVAYSGSEPNRLAGLAQLFGLTPANIKKARVLELGCASGGNIIPLAIQFPEADFVGIDLSQGQVDTANETIAKLSLANIKISYDDIATATFQGGHFDYIIAHGVYSWIPEHTQDAMLALIDANLSENGVAYVSYNTYPGWNMRNTVRDICSFHAGTTGDPKERVARARWMLDQIGTQVSDNTPYGQLMQREAEATKNSPDSYILGEFLADDNWPCYFHEFIARTAKHNLTFFSEADLAQSIPEGLAEDTAKLVRDIAGTSGMALEQYMDFFTGRQFRRSLLIKSSAAHKVNRKLSMDRLANLHLTSTLKKDGEASDGAIHVYTSPTAQIKLSTSAMTAALEIMQTMSPASFTLAEIMQALQTQGLANEGKQQLEIVKNVFQLVAKGAIKLGQQPTKIGRATDEKPNVFAMARHEVATGKPWMSSLLHQPVRVSAPAAVDATFATLIAQMDGSKTQTDLLAATQAVLDADQVVHPPNYAKTVLSKILAYLEENGLLIAPTDLN